MFVLLCSNPFMGLMFTAVGPVLPSLMQQFGSTGDGALTAQLIMTMPGIGIIVAGAPVGWMVERFGATTVLRIALLLFGFAGSAGVYAESLTLFFATRFLLGVAALGVATSTLSLVGEYFDADRRARVLSYQGAAGAAFGFVSLLLSGAMAEAWGWRAPFSLYLAGWVVLLCTWFALPGRLERTTDTEDRRSEQEAGFRALLPLWSLYLLIIVIFVAVFMNAVQVSFLLAADGISSPAVMSRVLAASAIANSIGAFSYGWLRERLGGGRTFVFCLVLMGIGYVVLGLPGGIALKVAGTAIASLGAGCIGPYLGNLLLDRARPEVRGRASGLLYTATFVGDFLNPLIVAPLRYLFGIHGAFVSIGLACLAGGLFSAVRRGASRQQL